MDFNPEFLHQSLVDDLKPWLELGTVKGVAARALRDSLLKKWEPSDSSDLEAVAVAGFLAANTACKSFKLDMHDPRLVAVMNIARNSIHSQLLDGPYQSSLVSLQNSVDEILPGPGSSLGTKHTSFYPKMFCSHLTTTDVNLYKFYRQHLSPRWLAADSCRASNFSVHLVEGSKLSSVPKNRTTNRTICTEPSLNMMFQKGIGSILEGLLKKHHNIDVSRQPNVNKEFARRGSIDGSYATIDLSSASDMISLEICEALLPRTVYKALMTVRSPVTEYKGEKVELHMMSSMGNGFTFPLMTFLFANLVRATYIYLGITPRIYESRNYGVFGDDIICLNETYGEIVKTLTSFGFIVNESKSFAKGAFRESCGGDYFEGHNVRGVYLKKVTNHAHIYSIFNRLARWSIRHNIFIPRSLLYLKGLARFLPVPLDAGDTEGFKCSSQYAGPLKTDRNGSVKYRAFIPRLRKVRVRADDPFYNDHGGIISFVGGYIRDECFTPRTSGVKYKIVSRRTPSWDFSPYVGLTSRDYTELFLSLESV